MEYIYCIIANKIFLKKVQQQQQQKNVKKDLIRELLSIGHSPTTKFGKEITAGRLRYTFKEKRPTT